MAYYYLGHYSVNDSASYQAYAPTAAASIRQYDGTVLAATGLGMGEATPIEGTAPHAVTVLIQFATQAAFERWYHSPEYQAVINLRKDASDGWVLGLKGRPAPA
jgi:uncharacterized protein (DUF1330 family)